MGALPVHKKTHPTSLKSRGQMTKFLKEGAISELFFFISMQGGRHL